MPTGYGTISEIYLEGLATARITCAPNLIPEPGQYLLTDLPIEQTAPLSFPVFPAGVADSGFLAASPLPKSWTPGTSLYLHGPLGRGFNLPPASRRIGLVVLGDTAQRLASLIQPALAQGAEISLLCDQPVSGLSNDIEIMPMVSLAEASLWADYLAVDLPREKIQSLPYLFKSFNIGGEAQILVSTPMPCGGRGDCGVCAVTVKRGYKLVCKDGPVFDLNHFL